MIITDKFVWLHFPKCAGTLTESLLRKIIPSHLNAEFDEIVAKEYPSVRWHNTVDERQNKIGRILADRDVISNFRRLPNWMLSIVHFNVVRRGPKTPKELYVNGFYFHETGHKMFAEAMVERYCGSNFWLRTECLADDICQVFSRYFSVNEGAVRQYCSQKINASYWSGNIRDFFNEDDLRTLYNACPKWSALEMRLYGNLLVGGAGFEPATLGSNLER